MHKGKYVFAQLLDFIDKDVFLRIANKYDGNRYVKQFTCWNQLAVLMFGQLSNRESLRDVVLATQAHASKAYHLGFGRHAAKSTLADANTKRDYRIFEEFAYKVISEAQRCRIVDIFKLNGDVYAFDSTTVDLCLSTFEWALFRKRKGGIKMLPCMIWRLRFLRSFTLHRQGLMIQKQWIEQHLKIKKFWGASENAVRIKIYSAIIAYCMMAIVQKKMNVERSIYEMLQIVSISLTDTTNLRDLFVKPNCNIVNELDDSTEPNLFNC